MQGPAPVTIVDPMLENALAYSLDHALMLAIRIALAITVNLHTNTRLTQLCIPVLSGQRLDEVGNNMAQEGKLC